VSTGVWCDDKPWNDIRYIPKRVKKTIIKKLSKYESIDTTWIENFNNLKKWINTEPDDYEKLQNSFIEFNSKIDDIRKEKFDSVFPEYSKLFT